MITWALHCAGIRCQIHYLDDFLFMGAPDSDEAAQALAITLCVLQHLGIPVAAHKMEGPAFLIVLRRPKGRARSTYVSPSHEIPRRWWSWRWTGMIRYAFFKSNFTNCVPRPRRRMCCTASSTEAYEMEDSSWEMPSLTLWSLGKERSTIVRHWSTRCDFGTSPMGLVCTSGVSRGWSEPRVEGAD